MGKGKETLSTIDPNALLPLLNQIGKTDIIHTETHRPLSKKVFIMTHHMKARRISFVTDSRAYPTRQCCARNRRARARPRGQTRSYRLHTFSIRHDRGKPAHYVKSMLTQTPQLSQ